MAALKTDKLERCHSLILDTADVFRPASPGKLAPECDTQRTLLFRREANLHDRLARECEHASARVDHNLSPRLKNPDLIRAVITSTTLSTAAHPSMAAEFPLTFHGVWTDLALT
jgi:hypothetical protein